ncbi:MULTISPECIES: acetyltransferase [unclassified Microbacterium]|uniref:PglD-related sugar-binding protein n=1 Tax=unclassified Microbacterium TaxID=2609290 RepID=UPI0019239AD9|nr:MULTISPECIES: acetyltransferase [unclassified Microbacterium]QYM65216.1 acetyltransferase [Microbacterium sp. Se5.02b]
MSERIIVIGAGGFGRETLDIVEALVAAGRDIDLVGVVDSGPSELDLGRLAERGIVYLGTEETWLPESSGDEHFVVAIGAPAVREIVVRRLSDAGLRAATLIHPRAVIGSRAQIGEGVVVASGVQVSTNVTLGDHVHLNPASVIGHDAALSDFVSVNPGAIVSGNVAVGPGSSSAPARSSCRA